MVTTAAPTPHEAGYRPMMRDMPEGERPRERLRDRGASYLSNAELLAILLRTGSTAENVLAQATRLLTAFHGLDGLARAHFVELAAQHGVGEAKACQLLSAMELGKRLTAARGPERPVIRGPQDVADLLRGEMAPLDQEHVRVLALNTKNEVLASPTVFVGSVNQTAIRPAEVFREAVRQNCSAVIVVHNHPSGDPSPSPEDVLVTRTLLAAGRALDIALLDHIVIGRAGHVSLKEKGLGFGPV